MMYDILPLSTHLLFKRLYFLYGKDAPIRYEEWWRNHEYIELVYNILSGGVLYEYSHGAFSSYEVVGIMTNIGHENDAEYVFTDEYIEYLGTL